MQPDPIWPQLLLQLVLILLNAFFAATEIAVLSLNDNILRRQAEDGDAKAKRLLAITQNPTRFLSTIQIGITLAGFLGSAFAADNFAGRLTTWLVEDVQFTALPEAALNSLSVVIITLVLSFFTLVLGELVPKRVAMQKADAVGRMACRPVSALSSAVQPVIWLLTVSTNGILRLFRIDPNAQAEEVSEEEIRMMVDIGEEHGTIEASEKQLIENVFEFNNMSAEDVMVHRTDMVMLWSGDSAEEIVSTIERSGLSRFPVYEEDADDIIGVLSTRDYLLNSRKPNPKFFRDLLRPAYFVPESVRTDVLFRDMQSKKVHLAIVVDEYGGTSGLVTMEDLLEELVGNIYDEFDPLDEQEIVKLEDNLWRVAGSVDLEDLAESLSTELPESEEYDTLGGLIFSKLSVIPEDGSHLEVDACGLHIRVEELVDRRVEWAMVSLLNPAAAQEAEGTS